MYPENSQAERQHEVRPSFYDEAEDFVKDHDGRILDACEGDGKSKKHVRITILSLQTYGTEHCGAEMCRFISQQTDLID